MPVNRQTVRELSRTTLYNITSSGQAWRAFLDAAARLYKYSFPEQVLIYAQEPEATAGDVSGGTTAPAQQTITITRINWRRRARRRRCGIRG